MLLKNLDWISDPLRKRERGWDVLGTIGNNRAQAIF